LGGGEPRLGEVNPEVDPYRTELARDKIEVFDLSGLKQAGDNAHDRTFDDITSVAGMVKQRRRDGQELTDSRSASTERSAHFFISSSS
jgi:esterase/lipase superfamily enzyme